MPSRSTTFGLYLHFGENSGFWLNLGIQALATLWILQLTLRVLGIAQSWRLLAISLVLTLTTALPWLASMVLTDIFAGLSVLSLFILVVQGERTSPVEKFLLFGLTAFAGATHSATLAVLLGLCALGWIALPFLRGRISASGLTQGSLTIVAGALLLLSTNFAFSGHLAWTPGGYGVAFGRMLQDGIVAHYLRDHCPKQHFKLCPYRDKLPATADEFLWGNSMFDTLGRFDGLNDEMGYIVLHSLAEYPAWQAKAALAGHRETTRLRSPPAKATMSGSATPMASSSATFPRQVKPMNAARQQHGQFRLHRDQRIHVPVALASMLLAAILFAAACSAGRSTISACSPAPSRSPCSAMPSFAPSSPVRMIATARGWCGSRPRWC